MRRFWLACILMACAAVSMKTEDASVEDLGTAAELVESLSPVPTQSADTETDTETETSDDGPSIVGEADQVETARRGRTPSLRTRGFFSMSFRGGAAGLPAPLVLLASSAFRCHQYCLLDMHSSIFEP